MVSSVSSTISFKGRGRFKEPGNARGAVSTGIICVKHIICIICIICIYAQLHIPDYVVLNRFLRGCVQLFPYRNKLNNLICDTEKMHSITYAAKDIARWGDTDNTNVEAPELAHKNWIKQQGGKTNQGPAVQKSMMIHTLRKEASALCCEAVQGPYCIIGVMCI